MSESEDSFGAHLKRLREARHLTLRDVETLCNGKPSNAYLSQLESDLIKSPSVVMLHRLAAALGVDFGGLCERACVGERAPAVPTYCPACGQPTDGRIRLLSKVSAQ